MKSTHLMPNKCKWRVVALTLVIAVTVAFAVTAIATSEDDGYNMFINDTVYADRKQYPFVDIFGEIYIPCIYLTQLEGVEIRESETLNNLLISYNGKYITFDLNSSVMYTSDGNRSDATVYLLYASENYIPAKKVCDYLGVKYEYLDGRIRISDKSAKKTFRKLIDSYILPAETEKETEEKQTVIDTTDEPRTVYIIIECGEYTQNYIDVIKEAGIPALFAMTEQYARDNTSTLTTVSALGCSVIPQCRLSDDEEEIKAQLQSFSDYISGSFFFTPTMFTTVYDDIRLFNTAKEKVDVICDGRFFFVPYTYYVKFVARTRASTMEAYLEMFIAENETAVFLFPDEETPCEALSLLIDYIGKHGNISVGTLSECNIPQGCIK